MASAQLWLRGRRFRVSVRVSMLLILIVALTLSERVNRANDQRRAVGVIKTAKGGVRYDYEPFQEAVTPGSWPPPAGRKEAGKLGRERSGARPVSGSSPAPVTGAARRAGSDHARRVGAEAEPPAPAASEPATYRLR